MSSKDCMGGFGLPGWVVNQVLLGNYKKSWGLQKELSARSKYDPKDLDFTKGGSNSSKDYVWSWFIIKFL